MSKSRDRRQARERKRTKKFSLLEALLKVMNREYRNNTYKGYTISTDITKLGRYKMGKLRW